MLKEEAQVVFKLVKALAAGSAPTALSPVQKREAWATEVWLQAKALYAAAPAEVLQALELPLPPL